MGRGAQPISERTAARDGAIEALDAGRVGSSELLAGHLPGARVVKALNAMRHGGLAADGRPPGDPARLAIPLTGDHVDAKAVVAGLIDQIGFDPVDVGSLAEGGRLLQPGSPIYARPLVAAELRASIQ